jgi:hypothetical protein
MVARLETVHTSGSGSASRFATHSTMLFLVVSRLWIEC